MYLSVSIKNNYCIIPNTSPAVLASNVTSSAYTSVFLLPNIFLTTSKFGRLSEGPASKSASAGPWCIPFVRKASKIGISVSVEKYMNAPNTLASRFALIVLLPTARIMSSSGSNGITKPAMNTPMSKSGSMSLLNFHVSSRSCFCELFLNSKKVVVAISKVVSMSSVWCWLFIAEKMITSSTAVKKVIMRGVVSFCACFSMYSLFFVVVSLNK